MQAAAADVGMGALVLNGKAGGGCMDRSSADDVTGGNDDDVDDDADDVDCE